MAVGRRLRPGGAGRVSDRRAERRRGGAAVGGIAAQRAIGHRRERRRELGHALQQGDRIGRHALLELGDRRAERGDGELPAEQLVEHEAGRVDVHRRGERAAS